MIESMIATKLPMAIAVTISMSPTPGVQIIIRDDMAIIMFSRTRIIYPCFMIALGCAAGRSSTLYAE